MGAFGADDPTGDRGIGIATRLDHGTALDARRQLGPVAHGLEQVELVGAGDRVAGRPRVRRRAPTGPPQERVGGDALRPLLAEPVGQLAEVPRRGGGVEVGPQPEVWVEQVGLGDDVEGAPHREHEVDRAERFEAAADPRARSPDALGNDPQLAEMGSQDGEDPVGLAEVQPAEDDGLGLVQRERGLTGSRSGTLRTWTSGSSLARWSPTSMRRCDPSSTSTAARPNPLYEMLAYHLGLDGSDGSTGKRIRPLLGLLVIRALGGDYRRAGAAVELGHNFSLVHDDIQDGDRERATAPRCGRCGAFPGHQRGRPVRAVAARALPARGRGERPRSAGRRQVLELMRIYQTCLSLCEGPFLDISFERRLGVPSRSTR